MLVACRLAGLSALAAYYAAVRPHVQFGPTQSPSAARTELRASRAPGGAAFLRHTQCGPQPRPGRRRGTLHSCGGEHGRPEVIPLGQTRVDPAVPDASPYRTSVRTRTRLATVRNGPDGERELVLARWGMPRRPQFGGQPVTNTRGRRSVALVASAVPVPFAYLRPRVRRAAAGAGLIRY